MGGGCEDGNADVNVGRSSVRGGRIAGLGKQIWRGSVGDATAYRRRQPRVQTDGVMKGLDKAVDDCRQLITAWGGKGKIMMMNHGREKG